MVWSTAAGELAGFRVAAVTRGALAALLYLAVFGSVVSFTAYLFLLRTVPPSIVSTYAFVNPVVAMALGWAFAGERLTPRTLLAAAVVIVAVALITTVRGPAPGMVGASPADAREP
jgi:drug/metabolite transporter (DMT)-like permease